MIDLAALSTVQYWIFLQVFVRVSALVAVAPALGASQVPNQIKIWMSVLLSAVLVPIVRSSFPANGAVPDNMYDFVSTLVLQAAVGLLMGFVVSMILAAFQMAGTMLDLQIGYTMAQELNPFSPELAAPLGQFQSYYSLLLFLLANGHHILIIALARSFSMLPASALDMTSGPYMKMISDVTFGALLNGLKISVPVVAVLTIVDLSFAFLSKAMPHLNIFYIGMPVKIIVGVSILILILPATAFFCGQLVGGEPQMLSDLLQLAKHT